MQFVFLKSLNSYGKVVMFDDHFKQKTLKFNNSKQHSNENKMVRTRSNVSFGARLGDSMKR